MFKTRKNNTIFWLIFIPMAAVLLSYVLVVVYFFSISPNNITAKMAVWSFFSAEQKGQMYQDATVDVRFSVAQEDLDFEDEASYRDGFFLTGVVISEDGFVVAPYHKYISKSQSIYIYAYSGKVFVGKLCFLDKNFQLCILKCENLDGVGQVSLPYVKISKPVAKNVDAIATSIETSARYGEAGVTYERVWQQPWSGIVYQSRFDSYYDYRTVDGSYLAVNNVLEYFYEAKTENQLMHYFMAGAIFNDYGYLIGLVCNNFELKETTCRVVLPVYVVQSVLENLRKCYYASQQYSNFVAENLHGLSKTELEIHMKVSDTKEDKNIAGMDNSFYFYNTWRQFDEHGNILEFYNSKGAGFLVLDDFSWQNEGDENEYTIPKFSVIQKVGVGGKIVDISSHCQLLQVLYGADTGCNVDFYFKTDLQTETFQTLRYVV